MIRVLRNVLPNFQLGMLSTTLLDLGGPRFGVDELALAESVWNSLPDRILGMEPFVSALC